MLMRIEFLNAWRGRTGNVIEEYLQQEAKNVDVFCFQEADGELAGICGRIFGGRFSLYTAYKWVDEKDIFSQAVYVKGGLTAVKTEEILKEIPNVGLGLSCQIENGNGRINLANIHGISRPGDKLDTEARLMQSGEIIQCLGEEEGLTIVGGDFNLEKGIKSVEMFKEAGYRNLIEEFKIRTTRNRLTWEKYPTSPQFYSDYVFVGPRVRVTDFKVIENEVSDHLPMVLEIE